MNTKYNDWRIENQYWIDRRGKIHKLSSNTDLTDITSVHYEIARRIYPQVKYPEDVLSQLGWILVGSTIYHVAYISEKHPTQAQINTCDRLELDLHIKTKRRIIPYSDEYKY